MVNTFRKTVESDGFERKPNPTEVHREAHKRSDVDNAPGAQHHTIGEGAYQAASGKKFAKLKKDFDSLQANFTALQARVVTLEGKSHTHV